MRITEDRQLANMYYWILENLCGRKMLYRNTFQLLGANVFQSTNLFFSHCRHNGDDQIFSLRKPILDLNAKKRTAKLQEFRWENKRQKSFYAQNNNAFASINLAGKHRVQTEDQWHHIPISFTNSISTIIDTYKANSHVRTPLVFNRKRSKNSEHSELEFDRYNITRVLNATLPFTKGGQQLPH